MRTIFLFLILFLTGNYTLSQSDTGKSADYYSGKKKVVAGSEYDISGLAEIFLGKHWRDLWTTPFEADIIDLNKYAGGLTPLKRGGGLQTKSLRFTGADGKVYKFRSMDKDPSKILPPDLQNTIVADAFQDQISTSNPFSAIIVASMLNQLGIINSVPTIVYMPDDERLGEYRKDFGNVLGTIEENPEDGNEDGEKGFGESDKITKSFKLYKKLEKDNDVQVDPVEFLKARMFDLMIGDWDRHSDQWVWAGFEEDGKLIYKPIPRDRDQAFCLYDGIVPFFVGEYVTQIEGYGENYPRIYDLSWNGRFVDRRFLPQATKQQYDSIAVLIQNSISDDIIKMAVKQMPENLYKLEGKYLTDMIISRKDQLREIVDEYYDLINSTADIYASDKSEFIEINNIGDDKVEVKMYKLDKDKSEKKGEPFFQKVFDEESTDEIRIYLNEGKDILQVTGEDKSSIDIRVIKDKQKLRVKGNNDNSIDFYTDTRPKKDLKERYEPAVEDRGTEWRFTSVLNYDTDNGFEIGGGPVFYKYGFRAKPYVYRMELTGSYAFNAGSYNFKYYGDFYTIIKNTRINLAVEQTQLAITRYFGEGNETPFSDSLQDIKYYDIKQELFRVATTFYVPFKKRTELKITPFYKHSNVSYDQNTLLGQDTNTYGIGRISFAGINTILQYDSRDNTMEPYSGVYAQALGNWTPDFFENNYGFGKAGLDLRAYISTDTVKGVTFAFRAGGGKVWGDFPFYESVFLGGANSLKGFSRERFAGDGVLLGEAEVRMGITRINILIPGTLGLSLFGGSGRVFLNGEDSKRWHSSFGATVWVSYLQRAMNIGVTVAKSDEGYKVFVGSGLFL
jgi:hypothetical protein